MSLHNVVMGPLKTDRTMKTAKLTEFLARVGTAPSILCLVVAVGYAAQSRSGHTGVNPYLLLIVFIPTFIFGAGACLLKPAGSGLSKSGVIAAIVGSIGILFLVVIDRANILLEYEAWISRGMP